MSRSTIACLITIAALAAAAPTLAEAQSRRSTDGALILRVRPRSFLDAGNVVSPGSLNRGASALAQTQAYVASPPYSFQRDRFGEGTLPDAIIGPYVGATNPFGPIDWR
jgi:hypothetical protein